MHFVLQCFSPLFTRVARLSGLPEVEGVDSWMAGRLITTPVTQPLEISLFATPTTDDDPDETENDESLSPEEAGPVAEADEQGDEDAAAPTDCGALLEMYQPGGLVMSKRLLAAFRDAGVDNLQSFDVVLSDPISGELHEHYALVNVVGVVACANLGLSQYQSRRGTPRINTQFESLVIDDDRAAHLDCFRLAECVSAVMVHDRVRRALLDRGFDMLTFQDPNDFLS